MIERFSVLSRQALAAARMEVSRSGTPSICSEHLLIGIVMVDPELTKQLGVEVKPAQIRTWSEQWHPPSEPIPHTQEIPLADELKAVFERAASNADLYPCREIRTEHFLLSLIEEPCHAEQLLTTCGLSKELIGAHVASLDCSSAQLGRRNPFDLSVFPDR